LCLDKDQSDSIRIRVAAIIQQEEKVLLVCHEKDGRRYWMLPGGGVKFGESLANTLIRELREEVGVRIHPNSLVLVSDAIAPNGERHILNLFYTADLMEGTPVLGRDPRIVEVAFFSWEEFSHLVFYPDCKETLLEMAALGFSNSARYLGNLWV